jgi:hypothetical protein
MVFLSTTLEPERISHCAMVLSASSEAEGISRPALASGGCSVAEGISRPPLASGTTSTPDPRVNLPDAPAFVERRVLTSHGSSLPCPSSRNRDGGGSGGGETLTGTGRIRGEPGWNLWAQMGREEPRRSHLSLRGPKYVSVSRRQKSIDDPTCQ